MTTVGERIRKGRKSMGWKQIDLASKAEISKSFLSNIENGKTRASGDSLLKIAQVLGVSIDFLLTGKSTDETSRPKSIEIPAILSQTAEEEGWSYGETIMLLEIMNSIVSRRSKSKEPTIGKSDWIKLYEKIKDFPEHDEEIR